MWYSMVMVADDKAKLVMQRVMDAFMPKYVGSGRPVDMALFSSYNEDDNEVTVYFSPKTASLAMRFGASPCDSDFVDVKLTLLAGDDRAVEVLFPDAQAG